MNKKVLTFLIVFLVLFSYSFSQAKQIKIIAEKANVYLDAFVSSYLIETLGKRTILDIYGSGKVTRISRDWYNVYYKSKRMGSDQRQLFLRVLLPHDKILPYSNRCLNRNLTF